MGALKALMEKEKRQQEPLDALADKWVLRAMQQIASADASPYPGDHASCVQRECGAVLLKAASELRELLKNEGTVVGLFEALAKDMEELLRRTGPKPWPEDE